MNWECERRRGWVDRSTSSGSACRLEEEGEAASGVKSC